MVDDDFNLSPSPFGSRDDDPPREYFEERGFGREHTEAADGLVFFVEENIEARPGDGRNGALSPYAFRNPGTF